MKSRPTPSERFAAGLFRATAPGDGNFVISPHSVAVALGLIGLGARGQTLECLLRTLSFKTETDMREGLRKEIEVFRSAQGLGVRFEADNSLWIKTGLQLLREYRHEAETCFGANVAEVSMDESGRKTINKHVSKVTHNLIPELLQDPLPKDSRIVATNALWLKAEWDWPFEPENTWDSIFHAPTGDTTIPFMHQTGHFHRVRCGNVDSLRLQYSGSRLVFEIIIPRGKLRLSDIEPEIELQAILEQNKAAFVVAKKELLALAVPKFSLSFRNNLRDALHHIGAGRIFDETADFTAIAGTDEPIMVSDVIHEARLDLDEDGTEAAAATADMCPAGGPPPDKKPRPKPFRADRPFLFAVRDSETGAVLFIGRVENPAT